jgi:hypothetical protein
VNAEGHESRNILPHLSKFGIESSIVHSLKAFRGSEEGNLKVGSMIGVPTAFDTLCPGEVTPNENTIKLNLPLGKNICDFSCAPTFRNQSVDWIFPSQDVGQQTTNPALPCREK